MCYINHLAFPEGKGKLLLSVAILWKKQLEISVIITILVIPIISALATVIFLKYKLKATPGDLIFERNQ
jgi:hypothetical protein